jgi:uncharacterized membrane protein (DUF106 family)
VTTIYAIVMLIVPASITGCRPLPLLRNLVGPFIASLAMGCVCWLFLHESPPSLVRIVLTVILGAVTYLAVNLLVDRARLAQDFKLLQLILFKKR